MSDRIPTASSIHAGFKAIRNTAREYHLKQAKSLILFMKCPISMAHKASQNDAFQPNEIKHLRADSYRTNLNPPPGAGCASVYLK